MTYNNASCKLSVPLHIWSRAFAAWVLVIIGLEGFIGILFPHRAQVINTKKRFAWITVAVAAGLAAFYTPLFVTIERALLFNYCKLTADLNRLKGYFTIFDEMSLLLTCLLPFVFIITFNIAIVSVLVKRRTALTSSRDNDSQTNSAVAMLISVSVAFVILTLPFGVYLILQKYYIRIGDMESYRKTIILYGFASICDSTNHAINVVLYCLTGRKFRQCLRKMVCCACLRTGFDGKGSQTTSQSTQDFRLDQSSSINSVTQATWLSTIGMALCWIGLTLYTALLVPMVTLAVIKDFSSWYRPVWMTSFGHKRLHKNNGSLRGHCNITTTS